MGEYTDSSVQLGCALDSRFDGTAHLELILSRGPWKMIQVLHELMNLGLPFTALRASLLNRVLPAAAFGIELVVHVSGFEKKLNSLSSFLASKGVGVWCHPSYSANARAWHCRSLVSLGVDSCNLSSQTVQGGSKIQTRRCHHELGCV